MVDLMQQHHTMPVFFRQLSTNTTASAFASQSDSNETNTSNGSSHGAITTPSEVRFFVGAPPDESDRPELKRETLQRSEMPDSPQNHHDTPTLAETLPPWRRPSDTPAISSARSASASVLDALNVSEIPTWIGKNAQVLTANGSTQLSVGDATNPDVDIVLTAPSPVTQRRSQKSESDPMSDAVDESGEAPNDCVIPPPWRHNDSPVQKDFHREPPDDDMVTQAEDEDDSPPEQPSPPRSAALPWRNLGKTEMKRPLSINATPTWRQLSSDKGVVRSPSVAATLDSLMPHPSCVSLRLSEAESHHSLHMHMQHLIDRPNLHHSPSHQDLDANMEVESLQLPHVDTEQRTIDWVLNLDADPTLPVDDRAFDTSYSTEPGQSLPAAPATSPPDHVPTDCTAEDDGLQLPLGSSAKTVHSTERTRVRCDSHPVHAPAGSLMPMTSLNKDASSMSGASSSSEKEEVSRL